MECIALGTGGMMPMPLRFTTSMLLRREGRMIMFDAGEGIQIPLKQGAFGIRSLDAVVISHLHADHVLGLPGIIMFRAQNEDPGPLTIVGPMGIKRFVNNTIADLKYHVGYPINFIEWNETLSSHAWSWNGCRLFWEPLEHSTFCLGFRVEEDSRPGKFYLKKAMAANVPAGPLFADLQAGKSVTLKDGTMVSPQDVMGPSRRGRVVTCATDTAPCHALERLCLNADLAFLEGMFTNEHQADATDKKHMTAQEAAKIAAKANVGKLILTHISPRYTKTDEQILKTEARCFFKNTKIATPLAIYPVALPD